MDTIGDVRIEDSTVGRNRSSAGGGGIFVRRGDLRIARSRVSGNVAGGSGGGI